jgi:hypothetical protein
MCISWVSESASRRQLRGSSLGAWAMPHVIPAAAADHLRNVALQPRHCRLFDAPTVQQRSIVGFAYDHGATNDSRDLVLKATAGRKNEMPLRAYTAAVDANEHSISYAIHPLLPFQKHRKVMSCSLWIKSCTAIPQVRRRNDSVLSFPPSYDYFFIYKELFLRALHTAHHHTRSSGELEKFARPTVCARFERPRHCLDESVEDDFGQHCRHVCSPVLPTAWLIDPCCYCSLQIKI